MGNVMLWWVSDDQGRNIHVLVNATLTAVWYRDVIFRANVRPCAGSRIIIASLVCLESVGSFWMTKALMPLIGPHIPQT